MIFHPDFLISFHSLIRTQVPGHIISIGTPKPTFIYDNDTLECNVSVFIPLKTLVVDLNIKRMN